MVINSAGKATLANLQRGKAPAYSMLCDIFGRNSNEKMGGEFVLLPVGDVDYRTFDRRYREGPVFQHGLWISAAWGLIFRYHRRFQQCVRIRGARLKYDGSIQHRCWESGPRPKHHWLLQHRRRSLEPHSNGLKSKGVFEGVGSSNTAVGYSTLSVNTADNNTAVGFETLQNNTTGFDNTAHGADALASNTTGAQNAAMGANTLLSNTTGFANTAMGTQALNNNTTGRLNTATGFSALNLNASGSNNTADGFQALFANTANNNTAQGFEALFKNTVGSNNT